MASAFRDIIESEQTLTFRYDLARFAVILPKTSSTEAVKIANNIQANVKDLNIELNISNYVFFTEKFITVSLGVATTTPTSNNSSDRLLIATEQTLKNSKNKGGNWISVAD